MLRVSDGGQSWCLGVFLDLPPGQDGLVEQCSGSNFSSKGYGGVRSMKGHS